MIIKNIPWNDFKKVIMGIDDVGEGLGVFIDKGDKIVDRYFRDEKLDPLIFARFDNGVVKIEVNDDRLSNELIILDQFDNGDNFVLMDICCQIEAYLGN